MKTIEDEVKALGMKEDFCQYLGLCDEENENTIENYCFLNYFSCETYKKYKNIDNSKKRGLR
jgi:hypothetical protein